MKYLATFGVATCLAAGATGTGSVTIVGWDLARGGVSSLGQSSGYASFRTEILAHFPNYHFRSVNVLSPANLAGATFIWLGSGTADFSAITPLTPSEQTALRQFVESGGTVAVFGENDSYAGNNSDPANESLMDPFGIDITGTFSGGQGYSIVSSAFPMSGPFGNVTNLSSNYPGYFNGWPSTAMVLARLAVNSQPSILRIPEGTLTPIAGNVFAFSDTGAFSPGGSGSGNWNDLYLNILSRPMLRLAGHIALNDFDSTADLVPSPILSVRRAASLASLEDISCTLDASGAFSVKTNASGSLDLSVKPSHWLRRTLTNFDVGDAGRTDLVFECVNGDVENDNEVNLTDYSRLSAAFGSAEGDPTWNERADLNGDLEVNLADYATLSRNFGLVGDD